LGGLVAVLFHRGLPQSLQDLDELGAVANTTGASCCQVLGGLPDGTSSGLVTSMLKGSAGKSFAALVTQPAEPEVKTSSIAGCFSQSIEKDMSGLAMTLQTLDYAGVEKFVEAIHNCSGRVLVSGLGKSGMIARRMAVSLCSIGKPAHFVHAAEWGHGDLGACTKDDVVVLFSHSGETAECVGAIAHFHTRGATVLSVTSGATSSMAVNSDANVIYSIPSNIEPVGGAPTTSVVVQDAIVNATMCALIERTEFTAQDFKFHHPGGSLGLKLK